MEETATGELFSLISDVEACSFAYKDVINLFQLLAEELENTAKVLDEDHPDLVVNGVVVVDEVGHLVDEFDDRFGDDVTGG